jgi:hypothetical protein
VTESVDVVDSVGSVDLVEFVEVAESVELVVDAVADYSFVKAEGGIG